MRQLIGWMEQLKGKSIKWWWELQTDGDSIMRWIFWSSTSAKRLSLKNWCNISYKRDKTFLFSNYIRSDVLFQRNASHQAQSNICKFSASAKASLLQIIIITIIKLLINILLVCLQNAGATFMVRVLTRYAN